MKRFNFKAIMYLICTYIASFGMIYLMWTGASYMFIDKALTKANYLDMVMIAVVGWYVTRDVFYSYYKPRRYKHGGNENMSTADNQHRNK